MRGRKTLRRIFWSAVALGAVAAIVWALRPRPVEVEIVTAARGSLAATVSGEGKTRVIDLFDVAAPVDGQLVRITVQPGDAVTADAVVARIAPIASRPLDARSRAQAEAAVAEARAALARAQATEQEAAVAVEHADSELARDQKLAGNGALPAADAEHAGHLSSMRHHDLDAAHAAVQQARAELVRVNAVLAPGDTADKAVDVTSPSSGHVLRVVRESAGPVAAGTPLVEIGDVTTLEVVADLLSTDAAAVRPGARATITGWGGQAPIAARVRRVDPAAFTKISALGLEEQRVHVVLDLVGAPPVGLGHDYRIDVAIVVWESKDALRVPSSALFRSGDRWAVYVVDDGDARVTPVDIGASDGAWTVATAGIHDGDAVIAEPSDAVRDGTRVTALAGPARGP
jgi:HlyD family secretion protein